MVQEERNYNVCHEQTIDEAFQEFLGQKGQRKAWIKTPTLWVYVRKTRKELDGTQVDAIEIANFNYGENRDCFKADQVQTAINTIHALNSTPLTYIEGENIEISPPTAALEEIFPLGAWLEDNGWERDDIEETDSYYYKLTSYTHQHRV